MSSRTRTAMVVTVLVLGVALLVALPARAQACELLNRLLVGCPTPAPPPPSSPPPSLPPLADLPGVITLPGSPAVPPPASPAPTLVVPAGGRPVLVPEAARHLLDLANAERASAGSQPLTSRPDVTEVAAGHSLAMAERGAIWHNAAYVTDAVANLLRATWVRGENVAWSNDVDHAHRLLMESSAHRMNMLDPRYSVAGFAVARSSDGNYWVTQNFLEPMTSPAPRVPAPGTVPAAAGKAPAVERAVAPYAPAPAVPSAPVVPMPDTAAPGPAALARPSGVLSASPTPALAHLDAAVLASDQAPVDGLAAALVALVMLGHGGSWWWVRRPSGRRLPNLWG